MAGIPELLSRDAIVNPNDVEGLADRIMRFITDTDFAQQEANKNWDESKKYHNDILTLRRNEFYEEIIRVSEA